MTRASSSSARRGSMWAGGAQPSDLPSTSQPRKDARPLRERAFQAKLRQDILTWLPTTGYDIDKNVLMNITGRDYRAIVYHLVYLLDPGYLFNDKARFEDEFVLLLRTLRYPFAAQVDPKWLAAPASMHAWPYLLAVLHWLSDMSKVRTRCFRSPPPPMMPLSWQARLSILGSGDPALLDPSDVPEEFGAEEHHNALAFEYTVSAYEAFMDGLDTFDDQDKMLEERYS
jgi:kinetochore protein NDC80